MGTGLCNLRSLSELLESAINGSRSLDCNRISGFHAVVLLESENDSSIILNQEALGVSADNRSFDLIDFIDRRIENLGNRRRLDFLLFAKLDKFPTLARDEKDIVDSIDAAHLRYKLDIQAIDSIRESKVNGSEPPFTGNVLNFTETIVKCLGPEFSVSGHSHLEVRLDKGI